MGDTILWIAAVIVTWLWIKIISLYTVYMKRFWYGVGIFVGLVILVVLQWPSKQLKIVACDVGQGDAILVIKGSTQVLVDGGPSSEKILSCLGRYLPFWDRKIELIVLTNTDYDHMNGLSSVVDRYQLMQFVTSDGVHESAALYKIRDRLAANGVVVRMVEQGDIIRILGQYQLELKVLWPPEVKSQYVVVYSPQTDEKISKQILGESAKRGDLNERSVVLLLLEDNKRILLTGDAGFQAETELLKSDLLSQVDYLKVGHHGSKYASSLEFLEKIKPKTAVISVGEGNRYGHPTSETLDRLKKVKAEVRRTDKEGDVVWTAN